MRQAYHEQLAALNGRLIDLLQQVTQMMADATRALLETDLELAEKVVADDASIDRVRAQTDEEIIRLLATQAPVASELRTVVAAMRITADIERMGDHAVHIAKVARMRYPHCAVPEQLVGTCVEMGRVAQEIAEKATEVLRLGDIKAARELPVDDDAMDRLHREMLLAALGQDLGAETAVDLTQLGRYFERYADHAVLVGSHVIYRATGEYE